ncbi:transcription factor bHLH110-like isoform X2 [Durio zibethinus]|uniref:Transcription factor bHLH110-like isoform X2 n=1 Tax=Durio zibethinus TaxID=66656 RepID=A0A6P6AVW9_DURZI|nr:transcription factor bHLH110-like isoform X2 [Durio zibethinus]
MEPENVHHQHQLQDQLVGSSSLPIPPSYGVASSTHSWTPTSSSIILNTSEFIPVYNGDISHSMQKNSILAYSSQNSSMIQDWTNNEGSFATHSCHDIHLAKIKEELSESLTRFTEMLSDTSSRDVGDSRQLPPTNYLKNNEQKDLHDLSEKLLLKTISSGFPMFSAGSEFYSTTQNCSIPGSTCLPSRRNFSQIYPSINISNLSQASSPNIPSSFDMNLEALDLLSPARFSSRSSFTNPSRDHNNLGIYKEISPSFGFHHHHFQQSNQRPAYSPSKISPFPTEIIEAKKPSILAEAKATAGATAKKSRLESRASCPPFKVRKEKLGDRIAALQQLVAPFGKTDTASVLMEAIGYIKFLQNQVETLSVPYMKSYRNKTSRSKQGGSTMEEGNEEEAKRDLRSRGLCLVPLSCMSYVTNDSGGSIWPPPNFTGGTYNNNC